MSTLPYALTNLGLVLYLCPVKASYLMFNAYPYTLKTFTWSGVYAKLLKFNAYPYALTNFTWSCVYAELLHV